MLSMGEAVFDLVGPVKNLREASPQAAPLLAHRYRTK